MAEQAPGGDIPGTDIAACEWPAGYGRVTLDNVGSTSDTAFAMARDTAGSFWVSARIQTAARGRQGRPWLSAEGNFAATLVLRTDAPPAKRALRSFSVSLALWRSFAALTGRPDLFALKWPNDVLLDGGKVAGILLESGPDDALLIGVGVNLAHAPRPDQVARDAVSPISLRARTGVEISPEAFLERLAFEVAVSEQSLVADGFGPLRVAWRAQAARLGRQITARTPWESITGRFADVDADGYLVLETAAGPRRIAAADVFF